MSEMWRGGRAAAGWRILPAVLACCGAVGCMGNGRVEQAGADVIDQVAKQTTVALDEYERDMQAVDAGRREAVVTNLVERVKRDGAQQVDAHAAALLQALERIAADRQVARERYEAAKDNIEVLREVSGGLRRFGVGVQKMTEGIPGLGAAIAGGGSK
jgi:hypothetical protein